MSLPGSTYIFLFEFFRDRFAFLFSILMRMIKTYHELDAFILSGSMGLDLLCTTLQKNLN